MTAFDFPTMDTKEASEKGAWMAVRTIVSGEPLLNRHGKPVRLQLVGPDSLPFRRQVRANTKNRMQRTMDRIEGDAMLAAEEADAVALLSACTFGWDGVCDTAGKDIPFTTAAAAELYLHFPAIRDQVDMFVASRSSFIAAASKT